MFVRPCDFWRKNPSRLLWIESHSISGGRQRLDFPFQEEIMNPVDLLSVWVECPEHEVSLYWISGPLTPKMKFKVEETTTDGFVFRLLCSCGILSQDRPSGDFYLEYFSIGFAGFTDVSTNLRTHDFHLCCVQQNVRGRSLCWTQHWLPTAASLMLFSTCRAVAGPVSLQRLHFFLTIFSQVLNFLITTFKTIPSWRNKFLFLIYFYFGTTWVQCSTGLM